MLSLIARLIRPRSVVISGLHAGGTPTISVVYHGGFVLSWSAGQQPNPEAEHVLAHALGCAPLSAEAN